MSLEIITVQDVGNVPGNLAEAELYKHVQWLESRQLWQGDPLLRHGFYYDRHLEGA